MEAGDLTAWVVAHVDLSKALLRTARATDAIAHLWPAVQVRVRGRGRVGVKVLSPNPNPNPNPNPDPNQDAPREASAPLRYQLALALALDRQHASAEPLLRQVIELEPTYTDASLALVSVLHAQVRDRVRLRLRLRNQANG